MSETHRKLIPSHCLREHPTVNIASVCRRARCHCHNTKTALPSQQTNLKRNVLAKYTTSAVTIGLLCLLHGFVWSQRCALWTTAPGSLPSSVQNVGLAGSETGVEYTDSGTQFAFVSKVIEPEGTECIRNVTFFIIQMAMKDKFELFSETEGIKSKRYSLPSAIK